MTIIAAYGDGTHFAIGCDSMAATEFEKFNCGTKLIRKNRCTIGVTGALRDQDLISEYSEFPSVLDINSLREFRDVWIALNKGANTYGASLLIISSGGVFEIGVDYSIDSMLGIGYRALGSGSEVARGSLYNSIAHGETAFKAVRTAVKAAIEHSTHCGFDVFLSSYKAGA